jgi:hypothetical protein
LDLTLGITDEEFWEEAEQRIYDALKTFSERADVQRGYQHKLFAMDSSRGFAFIDVCRNRYDAVVMNPPFGEFTKRTGKRWLSVLGNHNANDMYAAFVLRAVQLLSDGGLVGAITSRSGFFMGAFKKWRQGLFESVSPIAYCDLGYGVLDALVEVSCYVLGQGKTRGAAFINCLADNDKAASLRQTLSDLRIGVPNSRLFLKHVDAFNALPSLELSYWLPTGVLEAFKGESIASSKGAMVRQGLSSGDDFRFLRLVWEVPAEEIGDRWAFFAKGGEYSPFYDDVHLVVEWSSTGQQLWECRNPNTGKLRSNIWMLRATIDNCFFRGGWTYTKRTTSGFALKALPKGVAFSDQAMSLFPCDPEQDFRDAACAAAVLVSRAGQLFIEAQIGLGDAVHSGSAARRYTQAIVHSVPIPANLNQPDMVMDAMRTLSETAFTLYLTDETTRWFSGPAMGIHDTARLDEAVDRFICKQEDAFLLLLETHHSLDARITAGYSEGVGTALTEWVFPHPNEYPKRRLSDEDAQLFMLSTEELIAKAKTTLGSSRFVTKKVFIANRNLELISHLTKTHPSSIVAKRRELRCDLGLSQQLTEQLLSFLVGVAFGRFDCKPLAVTGSAWEPPPKRPPVAGDSKPKGILVEDAGNKDDLVKVVEDNLGSFSSGLGRTSLRDVEGQIGGSIRNWISKGSIAVL